MIVDQSIGTYLIGFGIVLLASLVGIGLWVRQLCEDAQRRRRGHLEAQARHFEHKGDKCTRRASEDSFAGLLTGWTLWNLAAAKWYGRAAEIRRKLRE